MIDVTQYQIGSDGAAFIVEAPFWVHEDRWVSTRISPDWGWFSITPQLRLTADEVDESFDCICMKHYHAVV